MGSFIDSLVSQSSPQELVKAFQDYRNFLLSVKERLPPSAYEFAAAPWHYDHENHRCPHDCWVESLLIREPSSGARHEVLFSSGAHWLIESEDIQFRWEPKA
jgi:hypothetical protein